MYRFRKSLRSENHWECVTFSKQ